MTKYAFTALAVCLLLPASAAAEAPVDVNRADEAALMSLPGIGKAIAGRIIASRESVGPFVDVADLRRVKGIGKRSLERLEGLVTVGAVSPEARAAAERRRAEAKVKPREARVDKPQRPSDLATPVDVNRAGADELRKLPGIGKVTAANIIADREANGPFASVDDLCRVKGLGQRKVDRLRGMLSVGGNAP